MSVFLCINFTLSVNTDGVKVCFNNPIIIVKSPHNRLNTDNYYESKLQQADPTQLTLRYWPCNGPIPATVPARYRTPVPARYVLLAFFVQGRYRFTVSARYRIGTGPIQGRYNVDCNGPVLARYSLYGIGPVPILYRANTGPIQ